MGIREFSDQFDVLYNNITSNQAPGLNEYEKSVFLTKAQEEIVKNYFSPKANPKGDGFDDSPKRQSDFSTIIRSATLGNASLPGFDSDSYMYVLPPDLFISLNEQLISNNLPYVIVPISYSEYDRLMAKPYKYPPKYQAWRLITNNVTSTTNVIKGSDSHTIDEENGIVVTMETYNEDGVTLRINQSQSTSTQMTPENAVVITSGLSNVVDLNVPSDMSLERFMELYDPSSVTGYTDYVYSMTFPTEDDYPLLTESFELSASAYSTTSTGGRVVEIRGRFATRPTYKIRYVKRPSPIILVQLVDGLKIQGSVGPSNCELPDEIHEEILQRAVELAKVAWTNNGQDNINMVIEAGKRSE